MKENAIALGLGALGGAAVAFGIWQLVQGRVAATVTETIDREVPPRVRAEMDHKLAEYGITPSLAASLRQTLENLDRLGMLQQLAQGTTPR